MYVNLKKRYIKLIKITLIISSCILLVSCSNKTVDVYAGLSAQTIYNQGKQNALAGKFSEAVKDFEALESNYPYGSYSDKAKLALIHAYVGKKEYLQAKSAADRFVRIFPTHPNVDYAHFMQGLAGYEQYYSTMYKLFKVDRSRREPTFAIQAFDDFRTLLERCPNSKYAADATKRMVHLRNQIALHNLYISEYYLAKKAYISALNRANLIISEFDQTIALEDALKIMIRAYKFLNMPELENNTVNLLNANFSPINSK